MSDPYAGWTTRFHLILLHPRNPTIHLEESDGGWSLPSVDYDDYVWWRNMEDVQLAIRAAIGSQLGGLHCLSRVDHASRKLAERVYLFETWGEPREGCWCDRRSVEQMSFGVARHREMVLRCLAEVDGSEAHDLRPPWARPGWFASASTWFAEQLADLGYALESPIQCIYSWPLAAVLHAETAVGEIYMKAASHLSAFVDEPRVTEHLASLYPDSVPIPIRIEPVERWMLLPDLGYPIRYAADAQKVEALLAFGQIQRGSVEHVENLLQLGCPDRRAEQLGSLIERFTSLEGLRFAPLDDNELERLPAASRRLQEAARRLAAIPLPSTLSHGDLHLGNVAHTDGRYVFFDWGQACVSHPFLDAMHFVRESQLSEMPEEYLELWSAFASQDQLLEAMDLATLLCDFGEALDQFHACVDLKPEPEESPECVTSQLREMIEAAERPPR